MRLFCWLVKTLGWDKTDLLLQIQMTSGATDRKTDQNIVAATGNARSRIAAVGAMCFLGRWLMLVLARRVRSGSVKSLIITLRSRPAVTHAYRCRVSIN